MKILRLYNLFLIVLSLTIIYCIILYLISSNSHKENYFPEDEVKYVNRSSPGIPYCKYQGLTPILTCSYDD
jgi:hypothetical protein